MHPLKGIFNILITTEPETSARTDEYTAMALAQKMKHQQMIKNGRPVIYDAATDNAEGIGFANAFAQAHAANTMLLVKNPDITPVSNMPLRLSSLVHQNPGFALALSGPKDRMAAFLEAHAGLGYSFKNAVHCNNIIPELDGLADRMAIMRDIRTNTLK